MASDNPQKKALLEKIEELPPEALSEVAQFVEFLSYRDEDRRLVKAAAKLSERALRKVWDNPDDAIFDKL